MFDLVVIGGGPAGVTAALRARELGAQVALVERGRLGGTCTNDGCVPTRVLAKAARLLRDSRQFSQYGLIFDQEIKVDFSQVIRRTQQVVYESHEKKQLFEHLSQMQVKVFAGGGSAGFEDAHRLTLGSGETIEGDKFVVSVGGKPRRLGLPGAELALTHQDVWHMQALPSSIAIVGSGATGCQLASVFEAFGVQVHLLEIAPRILMGEDEAVSQALADYFRREGINVLTGIEAVERIEKAGRGLVVVYKAGGEEQRLEVGGVLLSVGWPGNLEALNLEAAGIETNRGYIQTSEYLQTSAANIYAAGDVTGRIMLVQSATYQGRIAAENALLGHNITVENRLVPHGGFTDPEYGGVGLTEAQALAEGCHYITATVPYANLDRAIVDGRQDGFCKLIVDRQTLRLLGAHVVGEDAVEVVSTVSAGMAAGITAVQLAALELAYPTYNAVIGVAARQIIRELGVIALTPEWRSLQEERIAEWERRD